LAGVARESIDYDVVIVGGGAAGLSAAIRLKQLAAAQGREVSVYLLEKGSEIGAHILSGAVLDPSALDALIPDWKQMGAPLDTLVVEDRVYYLTEKGAISCPHILLPPLMSNRGMYVASLSSLCRWLGQQAEALGVEIYPGFAATEVLYGEAGEVQGVATGDLGLAKDGSRKPGFTPGMELRGKYTLFAEGVRGSSTAPNSRSNGPPASSDAGTPARRSAIPSRPRSSSRRKVASSAPPPPRRDGSTTLKSAAADRPCRKALMPISTAATRAFRRTTLRPRFSTSERKTDPSRPTSAFTTMLSAAFASASSTSSPSSRPSACCRPDTATPGPPMPPSSPSSPASLISPPDFEPAFDNPRCRQMKIHLLSQHV